jgi:hypothetical protein
MTTYTVTWHQQALDELTEIGLRQVGGRPLLTVCTGSIGCFESILP